MPEDIGSWPPAIAIAALAVIALKFVLDFISKRGTPGLHVTEVSHLNATLDSVREAMDAQTHVLTEMGERTRDLHGWHDEVDADTGLKRWMVPPGMVRKISDIHGWTKP